MGRGCIGKSNINNLPAPTNLNENPYGNNNSKIDLRGTRRNVNTIGTTEPEF